MDTLYIIGFFAIVFVLILIVGFIGNKVVDGMNNALSDRKKANRKTDPRDQAQTQSLMSRYQKADGSFRDR